MPKETNPTKPKRSYLSEQILEYAYRDPRSIPENHFLSAPTLCQRCQSEYVFTIREERSRKLLLCQYCGLVFVPKELAA